MATSFTARTARWLLVLATIAATISIPPVEVVASGPEYQGVGTAPVVGGNHVSARRRAIARARQSAVIAAVAATLSPGQLLRQATKLPLIYSRHQAYVRNYRVLSEAQEQGQYRVELACSLDIKRLRTDLQRLVLPKPASTTSSTQPTVSVQLKARFRADSELGVRLQKRSEQMMRAAGFVTASGAAARIGIEAVASVADGVRGIGLVGAKVDISYAVQLADGATLLQNAHQSAWGVGETAEAAERLAGQRALDVALREISAVLRRQWPAQAHPGRQVVRVSGVGSWRQFEQICSTIQGQFPGVQRCRPARLVGNDAWFWLGTTSSPMQLAKQLSQQHFNGFSLQVKSASGGALWFHVVESSP